MWRRRFESNGIVNSHHNFCSKSWNHCGLGARFSRPFVGLTRNNDVHNSLTISIIPLYIWSYIISTNYFIPYWEFLARYFNALEKTLEKNPEEDVSHHNENSFVWDDNAITPQGKETINLWHGVTLGLFFFLKRKWF